MSEDSVARRRRICVSRLLLAIGWWFVGEVLEFLSKLDNIVLAALIAVGGAVVTAITNILVKTVEKKQAVEAQFRERKVELFNDLLSEFRFLSELSDEERKSPEELTRFLKDWQRKLIF